MPRWKILPLQQAVLSCEAEKASLISDCSKEGGSFEYRYLWNLLSQKEHVVDPIFYLGHPPRTRSWSFPQAKHSFSFTCSWLELRFLDRGQKRLPFHSILPNQFSLPLLPSGSSPWLKSRQCCWLRNQDLRGPYAIEGLLSGAIPALQAFTHFCGLHFLT